MRSTLKLLLALALFATLPVVADVDVETHQVPSAEGITLATDIYHPQNEPAPVVLIRTPYGRTGFRFLAEALSDSGYVVALQDVRGKYDSSGDHEPFRHERVDGVATLKWIAAQSWCNDRIGMWGSSYSGYAALAVADVEMEAFRSIFSISGWLDVAEVVRPGGANHLMLNLAWMLSQQGRAQRNIGEYDIDALFRHIPERDALKSVGIHNKTWEDPEWMETAAAERPTFGKVARPVFQLTGWYDMVYRATLDAWTPLTAQNGSTHKLVIGPWYHNQFLFESGEVGDANFGPASGFGTAEMIELTRLWFDATLKGEKNGMLSSRPVRYFLMGQDGWHGADAWPPRKNVESRRWYLSGDGLLTAKRPAETGSDRFTFDPQDPVPTYGGANFFYFPEVVGVRDQREIERRDDVLMYTSPVLTAPLQITGAVRVGLTVATSGKDTDFTAKLVVVRPDGYARIVEEGIARASRTVGSIEPGEPFEIEIQIGHTAIEIPAGRRLRLEISSSNFPKYDRNPNTGERAYTATKLVSARQTVYYGGDRLSWLELPLRKKPLVANARSRTPLVQPAAMPEPEVAAAVGDDASRLIEQARQQLAGEEIDAAIASLKRAVELAPENSEAHHQLGRAYLDKLNTVSMFKKLGFSKKTRASYLRAIELDPDNVDARDSLAGFYFNAPGVAGGSSEKGLAQVEEIKKRDPVRALLLLAGHYSGQKKTAEAEHAYRQVLEIDGKNKDALYSLGLLYQSERRWDEAQATFRNAVERTADWRSLYQVGRTAAISGKYLEEGKRAFERIIGGEGDPAYVASAHWRLGMIYEQLDRRDRARAEYETALKKQPDLSQAREALEELAKSESR